MQNDTTQNFNNAAAPASADIPGRAAPPPSDAVQSAVFAALDETEENPLLRLGAAAGDASPIYGGLSRCDVVTLIRIYQAGNKGAWAWMLAVAWWRNSNPSPNLIKATAVCFREVFDSNLPRFMEELARATLPLIGQHPGPIQRTMVGHVDWWKVQVLEYMLQNPKPAYQIREFVRVIPNDLRVDLKDIRAFCKKHNIARDSRPGRPTKKGTL